MKKQTVETNEVVKSQKAFALKQERFERAFTNYVNALATLENSKPGKTAKGNRLALIQAEKQLSKIDPEFASTMFKQEEESQIAKHRARHEAWMKQNNIVA